MLSLFEFFYNNFIILSIITGSLLVFMILMRVFLKERSFNKKLQFKQGVLRNFDAFKHKYPSLFKFTKVFIPLLIPIIFILAFVRSPIQYEDHIGMIQSQSDIQQIYNDYHDKFYSMNMQSIKSDDIYQNMAQSYSQSVNVLENLDYVAHSNNYLFVADIDKVNIASYSDDSWQYEETIHYADDGLEVISLLVYDDRLIVITEEVFDDSQSENQTYLKSFKPKTHIFVYDINAAFEPTDHIVFRGKLNAISNTNRHLIIVNEQYLPFSLSGFELDDYMPKIYHNAEDFVQEYERIRYIKGTNPDSFLNIISIDLNDLSYRMETTLLNIDYQLTINDDDVYLLSLSHKFKMASEYVEMSNPVEEYETALTKFNMNKQGIEFFRTRIFSGMPKDNAFISDGFLVKVFIEEEDGLYAYRFNDQLGVLEKSQQPFIDEIFGYFYDNNILYIKTQSHHTRLLNVSNPNQVSTYDPPYTQEFPQYVIFQKRSMLLDMHLDDNMIRIDMYGLDDSLWLKQATAISKITHRSNMMQQHLSEKDFYYTHDDILIFPYIATNEDELDAFFTNVDFYHINQSTNERIARIHLPHEMHAVSSFVLRTLNDGDRLHLVTPKGIMIIDDEDYNKTIDQLIFP